MRRLVLTVLLVLGFAAPAWGATCEFDNAAANVPTIWTSGTQNVDSACAEAVTDDYEINTGQTVIVRGDGVDLTTGSVTVNGGTLIIEPGAVLQFGDGSATGRLAAFLQVSGKTVAEGTVLRTCRVISQPALASTSTVTLTTDCDMTGITSSHRLVFGDDDPEDPSATLTNQGVQVGPGAPSGAFRTSADSWSSYAVSSVSANTITYDIGSGHTFTSTGTGTPPPYNGTRTLTTYPEVLTLGGPGSTTDDGEIFRDIYGRYTSIAVNHDVWGEGSLCSIEADYGSRYLYMLESATNGDDPAICSGMQAKILSCENGSTTGLFSDSDIAANVITITSHGFDEAEPVTITVGGTLDSNLAANDTYYVKALSANTLSLSESPYGTAITLAGDGDTTDDTLTAVDRLIVAGDLTQCTDSTAHITMGARRGDKIHIVQHAVFEGESVGAAPPGDGGMLFLGGTLQANWARFQNLGASDPNLDSLLPAGQPDVLQRFNLMFAQGGSTGAITQTSGYLKNFDIQYPEAWSVSDSFVLGAGSNATLTTHRYPSDGVLDLTGLLIDRGHIHDCQNIDGDETGGCHGIYIGSADITASRIRIERMTDDGLGSQASRGGQTTEASASNMTFRHILSFEQLAGVDNSQECFSPNIIESQGADPDADSDMINMPNWLEVSDIMAIGCHRQSAAILGLRATASRLVTGGVFDASSQAIEFTTPGASFSAAFDNLVANYGTVVKDSYLGAFGNSSATQLFEASAAKLIGVFYFGGDIIRLDSNEVIKAVHVEESFLDNGNTSGTDIIDLATTAEDGHADSHLWQDSIFRSFEWDNGAQANVIANGDGTTETTAYIVRRLIHMASDTNSANAFNGTFDTGGPGSIIDGYFFSEAEALNGGTSTNSELWDIGSSVTVNAMCVMTNRASRFIEQPLGSGNDVLIDGDVRFSLQTRPTANEQNTLRGIVDGVASSCPAATPNYIGWRTFGIAHARLGDFVVMQNENFAYDPARPSWRIVKPVRSGDGRAAGSLTGSRAF